jgi:DNA-binding IclR family transcriptional regulator
MLQGADTSDATREAKLGGAQLRVLEALRADAGNGMTAREVAAVTGLKDTNTPRILKALAERGLAAASETTPRLWSATP